MEVKPTPGQWTIENLPHSDFIDIEPGVCRIEKGNPAAEANARLIVTTPEMRSVLLEIVEWFDDLQREQRSALIEGQTLESAAANWDSVTLNKGLDMTRARRVLAQE